MKHEKTSVFENGLIWFGAAVSIAEIYTGTLVAPLGFQNGIWSIVLGHLIGCILLFFAGYIGAKTEKSAMETVKISFGQKGSVLFSMLNILQLIGWTAIMIAQGGRATGIMANAYLGMNIDWLYCLLIGLLIMVWILVGIQNLGKLNTVAMGMLFLLTIVLSGIVWRGAVITKAEGGMDFGAAVELSVAMPLSWLPLISDYTKQAKQRKSATLVSAGVYFAVSCWMYAIGLLAALFAAQSDIAQIMLKAGLGIFGILILVFSTVTTTYMDAYSAGVSFISISKKISEKAAALAVCAVGIALAIFTPVEQFENFLYLIGSVFAPMITILITDYFILKVDHTQKMFNGKNLILWLISFILYRWFMHMNTPVGYTLPIMVITFVLSMIINLISGGRKYDKK